MSDPDLTVLLIDILVIALFLVLGIVFLCGKGAFLIAGYNTASKKEKAQIDEKKLCKSMGILLFLLAACWVLVAIGEMRGIGWLLWLGIILFLVMVLFAIVFANTKGRFRR